MDNTNGGGGGCAIHMSLQGKGCVGKSLTSSVLAQYFMARGRAVRCIDAKHAAYVGSWIKTLKDDKNEIFRAAHDASRAADFLLALERDRSSAGEVLQAAAPVLHSAALGGLRNVFPKRKTRNRERDRREHEAGLAPSAGSARTAPNQETLDAQELRGGAGRMEPNEIRERQRMRASRRPEHHHSETAQG